MVKNTKFENDEESEKEHNRFSFIWGRQINTFVLSRLEKFTSKEGHNCNKMIGTQRDSEI